MSLLDSIGSFFSGGADKAATQSAKTLARGATQQGATAVNYGNQAGEQITQGAQDAVAQLQKVIEAYGPYSAEGAAANKQMGNLLGLNGADAQQAAYANFQVSPDYQFRFDQGNRAVQAGAAAKNGLYSGSAGKALDTFGQGLASQEYGNYFNRLSGLAGNGLQAAGGTASALTNKANVLSDAAKGRADILLGTGNALGQSQADVANARAGGIVGAANARQQGIGNALSLAGTIAGAAFAPVTGGNLTTGFTSQPAYQTWFS